MELFRPDKPVSYEKEDKFQRYPFAKRIAKIVSSGKYPKSLVIGIYGKWGQGKTSVMHFIRNEISQDTVIINFNPWQFHEQKQLYKSFFESFASAMLKKHPAQKDKIEKVFNKYADALGSLSHQMFHNNQDQDVSERLNRESIEDLKLNADELILETNCNFVVFIDDIDRLDINEVQSIFKLVKLLGDFPRTSYILSFDDDLVAASLGPQYANRDKSSGYEFLEKIIQLPLHLPKANEQTLRKYTLELIENVLDFLNLHLSEKEISDFISKFDEAFLPAIDNPRLGVRFANSLGFSIPLLMGEIKISDLMAIEGIKTFYPELYHFIRNNQHYFLKKYTGLNSNQDNHEAEKKEVKFKLDEVLHAYDNKLKIHILDMLMSLFPQLKTAYENFGFPNKVYEQWYRERRICSPHYFERYFSYVVSEGDISDIYFNELLADLERVAPNELVTRFTQALEKVKPDIFLFKLNKFIPAFSLTEGVTIAKALAQIGNLFYNSGETLLFSTINQLGFIIYSLLRKVPADQRLENCLEILHLAKPFEFAMVIQNKFRNRKQLESDEEFLSGTALTTISGYLINKLEQENIKKDLFSILPDHELRSLLLLYSEIKRDKDVKKLLKKHLKSNYENALSIIRVFTPTIHSSKKPAPYKGDFDEESYHDLMSVVDTDLLYYTTLYTYGTLQYEPDENTINDEISNANLIAKFQKMHLEKNNTSPSVKLVK
jgi:predicted KAP-like P-loop ATPase